MQRRQVPHFLLIFALHRTVIPKICLSFIQFHCVEGAGSMADKKHKTWLRLVYMILTDIGNHRFASVFQNPIKEQDAPGYYSIVKQPMDLKTIRKRLRDFVCGIFTESLLAFP